MFGRRRRRFAAKRRRSLITEVVVGLVVAGLAGTGIFFGFFHNPSAETAAFRIGREKRTFSSNDPVGRACALPKAWLARIWRGHDPQHSEDITIVPQYPNYSGAFSITSHSGPWRYLQNVPLVLYGPGFINDNGPIHGHASITDIYPTVGKLAHVTLPPRQGQPLQAALIKTDATPKLIVVIVWDGVGRNVLERWPNAWPNLARLEQNGTSYLDTMVGSSPSITPASHSSIGTGAFPRSHGVTAISFRDPTTGKVRSAFANRDPVDEKLTTFSDDIDRAYGNKSQVGLLAWKNWHIGLLGHGAQTPGGDHDQLALISSGPHVSGNDLYYSTPSYLDGYPGLTRHARALDRADGKADGEWMGHSILKLHDNPAWVEYESDLMQAMLKREGYGTDDVPDIFLTNFKITDIVGHQYSMDSPEEQAVLHAQDAALGRLVTYLDKAIKNYVVVVTADHGHTPNALRSGAWPISESELARDVDAHFHIPSGQSLIDVTSAVGPFLNHDVMTKAGVTAEDIARFLNSYTLSDNWKGGQLPSGYQDRADEQILSAAFPQGDYPQIMQCAFGANKPPPGLGT